MIKIVLALLIVSIIYLAHDVLIPVYRFDPEVFYLRNRANTHNPTYEELISFISSDNTNEHPYSKKFDCTNYAIMVHNNAENIGIRAGYIVVKGLKHAFNVFETTDKGLIYIDCTCNDSIVDISQVIYQGRPINGATNEVHLMKGKITGINICW